ncbi:MAG: SH3 domain-containing protein [Dehalococcoidia bacterium]|nr:SH3 domain-containing protein [Dehalococcoidia bacterium]
MAKIFTLAVGLALALAVVACGGEDGTPRPETATPAPSVTATPGADESPQAIDGVEAVPLAVGDEAGFPDDVALIISTGCWQCDGPTTGLERVYRDPSGEIIVETLFTPEKLGLPPRIVQTDKGPQKDAPTINGFALTPEGGHIVVSVCTRGTCLELGGPPSDDAQTTLFESTDGGVTWEELALLDGGLGVRAITEDGALLVDFSAPFDAEGRPSYRFYLSGRAVEPPAGAVAHRMFTTPDGVLLWSTDDGRLLRDDGSEYLSLGLPQGSEFVAFARGPSLDPLTAVVWFEEVNGDGSSIAYYLGILNADHSSRKVYRVGDLALPGGWLGLLLYGNTGVLPEQLPMPPPDLYLGWLPAVLDIEGGEAHPILDPFLDRPGRNLVHAVVEGPFARVAGTDGCLNVREKPAASGTLLECAAEGVLLLLRGLEDTIIEGGVTWVHVVAPAGADGWASGDYLER